MLIDTHCHLALLDDARKDIYSIIQKAQKVEVISIVDVSVGTDGFLNRKVLVKDLTERLGIFISMTAGISPYYAGKRARGDLDLVKCQAGLERRVVAIGEIGLDYFHNWASREEQMLLFSEQIDLANELRLPIVVHTRDSDGDLLSTLRENMPVMGGIIHCFTSGVETARALLGLGFYLSFAGNLTYKKSGAIREAARFVPVDRYLLETDAPYLAPEGFRGRQNEPALLEVTARFFAEIRGISFERLAEETTRNARAVLSLD